MRRTRLTRRKGCDRARITRQNNGAKNMHWKIFIYISYKKKRRREKKNTFIIQWPYNLPSRST